MERERERESKKKLWQQEKLVLTKEKNEKLIKHTSSINEIMPFEKIYVIMPRKREMSKYLCVLLKHL